MEQLCVWGSSELGAALFLSIVRGKTESLPSALRDAMNWLESCHARASNRCPMCSTFLYRFADWGTSLGGTGCLLALSLSDLRLKTLMCATPAPFSFAVLVVMTNLVMVAGLGLDPPLCAALRHPAGLCTIKYFLIDVHTMSLSESPNIVCRPCSKWQRFFRGGAFRSSGSVHKLSTRRFRASHLPSHPFDLMR